MLDCARVCTLVYNCAQSPKALEYYSTQWCTIVHNSAQFCTIIIGPRMPGGGRVGRCAGLCTSVHTCAQLHTELWRSGEAIVHNSAQLCTIVHDCAQLCIIVFGNTAVGQIHVDTSARLCTIVHACAQLCTIMLIRGREGREGMGEEGCEGQSPCKISG